MANTKTRANTTEAKEQKNKGSFVRKDWEQYHGIIDEDKMEEAGEVMLSVYRAQGRDVARAFYKWLHASTKQYLLTNQDYKALAKILRNGHVSGIVFYSGDEIKAEFSRLLKERKYEQAIKIGNRLPDTTIRCRASYHLETLITEGRVSEARRCARILGNRVGEYLNNLEKARAS